MWKSRQKHSPRHGNEEGKFKFRDASEELHGEEMTQGGVAVVLLAWQSRRYPPTPLLRTVRGHLLNLLLESSKIKNKVNKNITSIFSKTRQLVSPESQARWEEGQQSQSRREPGCAGDTHRSPGRGFGRCLRARPSRARGSLAKT